MDLEEVRHSLGTEKHIKMKYIVFVGLSLLAVTQAAVLDWDILIPRIINGQDAKPGEIPYQVSLQTKKQNFHFCGGSILTANYVITAAHCVVGNKPDNIQVVVGTLKLSEPKSLHLVEQIITHKDYNPRDAWKNDIALLKLKEPIVMTDEIKAIPLPHHNAVFKPNQKAVVSGWGRLLFNGPTPDHLQRADLVIADQTYCVKKYAEFGLNVHDSQICAYDPKVMRGSCNGDSGGPLTVNGVLVGLVSWANGCAKTDYPTVYTRVPDFLDWIAAHAV